MIEAGGAALQPLAKETRFGKDEHLPVEGTLKLDFAGPFRPSFLDSHTADSLRGEDCREPKELRPSDNGLVHVVDGVLSPHRPRRGMDAEVPILAMGVAASRQALVPVLVALPPPAGNGGGQSNAGRHAVHASTGALQTDASLPQAATGQRALELLRQGSGVELACGDGHWGASLAAPKMLKVRRVPRPKGWSPALRSSSPA